MSTSLRIVVTRIVAIVAVSADDCDDVELLDELRYSDRVGAHLCMNCVFSCERCDEYDSIESSHSVDDCLYCEDCYSNRTFHCEECDTSYPDHHDSYGVQDQTYCSSCYESECYYCDECGDAYRCDDRCNAVMR
jgi:hypothetical protein